MSIFLFFYDSILVIPSLSIQWNIKNLGLDLALQIKGMINKANLGLQAEMIDTDIAGIAEEQFILQVSRIHILFKEIALKR